jgi:hypothetical protein
MLCGEQHAEVQEIIDNYSSVAVQEAAALLQVDDDDGEQRRGLAAGVRPHSHAERGDDFYPTPPAAVRALLKVESFEGVIWECACGDGAIARVLRTAGLEVIATDLKDRGCPDSTGDIDFLAQTTAPECVTTILTNPPLMHADKFVWHALRLGVQRVVMLLPLDRLAGQKRSGVTWGGWLARVYVFQNRLPWMHRDGEDGPRADTRMEFAWYLWDQAHCGDTVLRPIWWKAQDSDEAVDPEMPGIDEAAE